MAVNANYFGGNLNVPCGAARGFAAWAWNVCTRPARPAPPAATASEPPRVRLGRLLRATALTARESPRSGWRCCAR